MISSSSKTTTQDKKTHKHTNKETSKQTHKQTNKHTNKQTNKHTNKQANKEANKQTSKQTNKRPVWYGARKPPKAASVDSFSLSRALSLLRCQRLCRFVSSCPTFACTARTHTQARTKIVAHGKDPVSTSE